MQLYKKIKNTYILFSFNIHVWFSWKKMRIVTSHIIIERNCKYYHEKNLFFKKNMRWFEWFFIIISTIYLNRISFKDIKSNN